MWLGLVLACATPDAPAKPALGQRIDGTLNYSAWLDGELWCDTVLSFTGTSDDEPCSGCEFSFASIAATVVSDSSAADCVLDPRYSWVDDWDLVRPGGLFYRDSFTYYDHCTGEDVTAPADLGPSYQYDGYPSGGCATTYYANWYSGGAGFAALGGSFTRTIDAVSWSASPDPHATPWFQVALDVPLADEIDVSASATLTPAEEP
jgi:hypothetical protein